MPFPSASEPISCRTGELSAESMIPFRTESQLGESRLSDRRCYERSQIILKLIDSALALLATLLSACAVYGQNSPESRNVGVRDFAAYWAVTRLLLNFQDPYSPPALFDLQWTVGLREARPLVMWHPPWTLSFTLPFGVVDFSPGQFLWLLKAGETAWSTTRFFGA